MITMRKLTFEIPDEVYEAIEAIAARDGKDPRDLALEWLAEHTPKPRQTLTPEESKAARQSLRRHFGAVNSGNPRSADNEQIDADLAREYGSTHEEPS